MAFHTCIGTRDCRRFADSSSSLRHRVIRYGPTFRYVANMNEAEKLITSDVVGAVATSKVSRVVHHVTLMVPTSAVSTDRCFCRLCARPSRALRRRNARIGSAAARRAPYGSTQTQVRQYTDLQMTTPVSARGYDVVPSEVNTLE